MVPGTLALPHAYGRLQFGADLALTFRTLIGNACNPNVASVVVIGIEPTWTGQVVEGIAKTGKKVEGFSVERNGDLQTVERAARVAARFLQDDSEFSREPVERHEIMLSIKCGDPTPPAASAPARPPLRSWTAGSRLAARCCSARPAVHWRRAPHSAALRQ